MAIPLEVPFLAPIAVGAEVLVVSVEEAGLLSGWDPAPPMIVDRSTGVLFGAEWVPNELHAGYLELEQHAQGRFRRTPGKAPLSARVVSCLVKSRGSGEQNVLRTFFQLEPLTPGGTYR